MQKLWWWHAATCTIAQSLQTQLHCDVCGSIFNGRNIYTNPIIKPKKKIKLYYIYIYKSKVGNVAEKSEHNFYSLGLLLDLILVPLKVSQPTKRRNADLVRHYLDLEKKTTTKHSSFISLRFNTICFFFLGSNSSSQLLSSQWNFQLTFFSSLFLCIFPSVCP